MDIAFHYPPELFELLVDTIPLLCRSKEREQVIFDARQLSLLLLYCLYSCLMFSLAFLSFFL